MIFRDNLRRNDDHYEFLKFNDQGALFKISCSIKGKERVASFTSALIYSLPIFTLALKDIRYKWMGGLKGRKIVEKTCAIGRNFQRFALLIIINHQKMQHQSWQEIIQTCPEAFEFAPYELKNDPLLATAVISKNRMMFHYVSESLKKNLSFLQQVVIEAPRTLLELEHPVKEQLLNLLPIHLQESLNQTLDQQSDTGIDHTDFEYLKVFIERYQKVWIDEVNQSDEDFIYLKSKFLRLPYSIQVFKDGRIWIHSRELLNQGKQKCIKAVYSWNSKEKYIKAYSHKYIRYESNQFEKETIEQEKIISQKLKNKRGIITLIDSFDYSSKFSNSMTKTVLVFERFSGTIVELQKWTEHDLKVICLDLLYGVKAFKENGLQEHDFHHGNVLVLRNEEGKASKAVLNDFGRTEQLTILDPNFNGQEVIESLQNGIVNLIRQLYCLNKLQPPSFLMQGYYYSNQINSVYLTIEELIQKMENFFSFNY